VPPTRIRAEPGRALDVVTACGGLPLALRIVATRLATRPGLSVADLADRLADQQCRLRELMVGDIAVNSAFDLSYRMLTDRERLLFLRLSLAPVPDFSTAAAAVLADLPESETAELLDALADVNLLEPGSCGSRYRMHDLVRLYARHLAATDDPEAQRATDRLSAWYIARLNAATRLTTPGFAALAPGCAVTAAPAFDTATQAAEWLEAERAGIVAAAVRSARRGPYPPAWLLADALRGFFYAHRDTDDWLTAARAGLAAARRAGDRSAMAAMLTSLGLARSSRCQYGLAISHYCQAVSLADEWPAGRAAALGNLGIVYYLLGQLDEAQRYYRLSLALNRRIGNRHGEAIRLGNLAGVYHAAGAFPEAARHYTEALTIYRELGNRHGEAIASCSYANVCREMGRPGDALALIEAALEIAGQLQSRIVEAVAECSRAASCLDLGRYDDALRAALRAVIVSQTIEDGVIEVDSLNVLGEIERSRGDTVNAAVHHTDARAKARHAGFRLGEIEALIGLARSIWARGELREAEGYAQQAVSLAAVSAHRLAERQARACLQDLEDNRPAPVAWAVPRQRPEPPSTSVPSSPAGPGAVT
jgi:tetratricopeptide (TPR) repeat protein